jgi:hypothetical protein
MLMIALEQMIVLDDGAAVHGIGIVGAVSGVVAAVAETTGGSSQVTDRVWRCGSCRVVSGLV